MPATDPEALKEFTQRCPGAPPPAGLWRSPGLFKKLKFRNKGGS